MCLFVYSFRVVFGHVLVLSFARLVGWLVGCFFVRSFGAFLRRFVRLLVFLIVCLVDCLFS